MDRKTLREHYQASPFRPFKIHLADGRSLLVDHPEWMAISPNDRTLSIYEKDGAHHLIDVPLIIELEVPADVG